MDRPIIFSAPMVRALIEGRKTQTRRVLKAPYGTLEYLRDGTWRPICTKFFPGDRLWVREAFNSFQFSQDGDEAWPVDVPTLQECREAEELAHRFGAPQIVFRESDRARKWFSDQKWRSPIHMPRWASRITLIVTDVRVQRLAELTDEDAIAEGIYERHVIGDGPAHAPWTWQKEGWRHDTPGEAFRALWNSIHGDGAWGKNPWVAAISFTVHKQNINQMGAG